jgi:hypothetical protein
MYCTVAVCMFALNIFVRNEKFCIEKEYEESNTVIIKLLTILASFASAFTTLFVFRQ